MNIDADCKKALRWAAQNRPEAIQRLLNANPGTLNRSGWTALTFAASAGYEMVVRLLLRRGDNPDARAKDGSTPLMCSAWFGHEVVVKLLLDHGNIDVNAKNEAGQTALWYASRNGHDRVVRLLLERDDVDQNSNDGYGRTPRLRLGRDNVKTDIHGDPSTPERPPGFGLEEDRKSRLRIAGNGRNEAVNPNHRRHSGSTPLLLAASNGDEAMVRLLLQQGDNPDPRGQNGDTPLICAARNGHEGVVQLLLECPGVDADANNEASQTPLWCAAENGHDGVVRLLLDLDDVDPDTEDEDGWTPLMIAADKGHVPVVQLLLQRQDVNPNLKDENGWTALMIAADKGHVSVVQLLLQRQDVDPNSKDVVGWTPVMKAAYNGHQPVVQLLQDVDQKPQSVDSSLTVAPENVHLEEEGTSLESIMSRLQLDTSARPIQTTNERMFDEVKHKLAYDFLSELDNKVTGGQIASKTALGGGVKITWSKKLKTTAGRASWEEKINKPVTGPSSKDTSSLSVTNQHIASIELSEKVIDDEDRLLNTVAHQLCHLACFIISNVDENHGEIFKEWGKKCNQAFGHRGVIVTTKHSYGVCGVKLKRHTKSVDFPGLLPIELSLNIIKYLDGKSLCRATQVSKRWKEIINTDYLTWKGRFDDDGFVLAEEELESAIREGWLNPSGFDKRDTSGLSAMRSERESPYAAARAVPNPAIGFKSLYQKHYLIRKDWMGDTKPRHISICAHPRNKITCLQFDTEKILVGSDDAYIDVYDIKTGALRKRLEGHEDGVWVLELHGNTLVSSSTDDTVRVWDIEKGVCTQVFKGHAMARCLKILMPARVRMMPDGQAKMVPEVPLIITGSRDSNIRVWKLPLSGDKPFFPTGPSQNDFECPYFVRTLLGHHDTVRAIAAHADTLVSGSYDSTVRIWKTSTGEAVHCLQGHTQKVYSVVLDHKRNRCISGSMDNLVKIWSLETGGLLFSLEGHTDLVDLLDLSHDRLVSAADSTLRIWNPENGQCRSTLSADAGDVTCFQHDSQKVVVGSNHTLKMWNVQNGEFVKDLLTDFTTVWQVKFDERRCVAAVKRNGFTHIEVLDFGASRHSYPENKYLGRTAVDAVGCEFSWSVEAKI